MEANELYLEGKWLLISRTASLPLPLKVDFAFKLTKLFHTVSAGFLLHCAVVLTFLTTKPTFISILNIILKHT